MSHDDDAGNAAQSRYSDSGTSVQGVTQVESSNEPTTERPTKTGFAVLDATGREVSRVAHIDEALRAMRRTYAAESVVRLSDGAPMASKLRRTNMWAPRPFETSGCTVSLHWGA